MTKILFILSLFLNCSNLKQKSKAEPNKNLVEVNYRMFICQGESTQWCLQVRDKVDTAWRFFYDRIDKFDYEWGYTYLLDIEQKKIENPAQDASSFKWILKSIVKKTRVPANTSFDVELGEEKAEYDSQKKKIIISGQNFSVSQNFPVSKLYNFTLLRFRFTAENKLEVFEGR